MLPPEHRLLPALRMNAGDFSLREYAVALGDSVVKSQKENALHKAFALAFYDWIIKSFFCHKFGGHFLLGRKKMLSLHTYMLFARLYLSREGRAVSEEMWLDGGLYRNVLLISRYSEIFAGI